MTTRTSLFLIVCLGHGAYAAAQVDYVQQIKPLFAEKCGSCHSALNQEAGLRLDAATLILKGSESGVVIAPGDAAQSELIRRVTDADVDTRMPPEGAGEPLTSEQVQLLKDWINQGAKAPSDEEIPADPLHHWAYQTPKRPAVPRSPDAQWSHPIDAFIAAEQRSMGLRPLKSADRTTLLRRLYFDVIGLPPSRRQLLNFLADPSGDAWTKVIDSLLENVHYGERWGRHWMDVWRYSDWDGYKQELRGSQRHIWRWRDWIIESLNEDKPYDRMVTEMLAGDELSPDDPSVLRATGFLARNFHKSNRDIWLDATVEHTAKAFLGLTLNCARCHDHKYDPIPQLAYYQFRAIFEPHQVRTDQVPDELNVMRDGIPRAYDASLEIPTYVYLQGNEKRPDKSRPVAAATPEVLGGLYAVEPVELPLAAYFPAIRPSIVEARLEAARERLSAAHMALQSPESHTLDAPELELLEQRRRVAQLGVYALQNRQEADQARLTTDDSDLTAERSRVAGLIEQRLELQQAKLAVMEKEKALRVASSSEGGDEKKRRVEVEKAKKELAQAEQELVTATQGREKPKKEYTPLGKEYPQTSSGRRLALARWITSTENPLTARVAVNHVWLRHFGEPLVKNVFDFGLRSPRPAHAELLDWLAVELMENDWSLKHLHRLILTSRTWQQRSSLEGKESENLAIDPDNQFFWRANIRRLDAEIVRDNVLAVSGQLKPELGGPDIDFRKGEETQRRSIYLRHAYEKQMTMLVLFDAASPNECYRRSESIVPQQALALANSTLSLAQSRLLARSLWEEVSDDQLPRRQFVNQAFLQILARMPGDDEADMCLRFLEDQSRMLSDPKGLTTFVGGLSPRVAPATAPAARARENLVHVLMNHNDFVTVR